MFQYSLVLFTSITIENFVIFCSLEEKLVKIGRFRTYSENGHFANMHDIS